MTTVDPQTGPYPTGNTPGVRRHRIAAVPMMAHDTESQIIVIAGNGGDERTLRIVSTSTRGKRFVEVGLSLDGRRELIEALGGVTGPDWGDQ